MVSRGIYVNLYPRANMPGSCCIFYKVKPLPTALVHDHMKAGLYLSPVPLSTLLSFMDLVLNCLPWPVLCNEL